MKSRRSLVVALLSTSLLTGAENSHWIVTWGASASPAWDEAQMRSAHLVYENQTVREIVHTSIGGVTIRVRLSNAFGKTTVAIGSAHIAMSATGGTTVAGTDHPVTFSGRPLVSIPPNAVVTSDPIQMTVPAESDVAISLFIPNETLASGVHFASQQTIYVGGGDLTAASAMPNATKVESWVFLSGLDVMAGKRAATLVAFGDSITDGAHSTTDANHRWPNFLADRLLAKKKTRNLGVLDAGIGGNRVLHDAVTNLRFGVNALARFDRDVLAQPGVKYVIVLEGINDLGHPGTSAPEAETVSAEDLVAGLRQLVERAHENGLKIIGATLTPFSGTTYPGYFTAERESKRKAVNAWILTGGAFDGVIDFDKATQDPNHPEQLRPAYDSGDHLHPNDAGYKAMAEAIELSLFR